MKNEANDIRNNVKLSDITRFLKDKRGRAGKLALALGVPPQQLSNWLHGRFNPSEETMEKINDWITLEHAQEAAESAKSDTRLRSVINSLRSQAVPSPAEQSAQPEKNST